jgi:hypothetical protein
MKVLPSLITLTSLTRPDVTSAFNNPCSTGVLTTCSATANRRDFISTAIATSVAVGGSSFFPAVSLADVSDGNSLPQGAAQFSRVIKVRAQLKVSYISPSYDVSGFLVGNVNEVLHDYQISNTS